MTQDLKLARPALTAVEDGDEFDTVLANAVTNFVGCVAHYQFGDSNDSAGPADLWLGLEEIDRTQDALSTEAA